MGLERLVAAILDLPPDAPSEGVARTLAAIGSEDPLAERLIRHRVDLARAHETRRRVAHDLRGSLAVVTGQCEMLSGQVWGPINAEQKRALDAIRRHSERIAETVDRWKAGVTEP